MFRIITPIKNNESGGENLLQELVNELCSKLSIKNKNLFIFRNEIFKISNSFFLKFFNRRQLIKLIALISLIPNIVNIYIQIKRQKEKKYIYVCSHYLSCLPLLLTKLTKVKVNYIFCIQASEWKFIKNKILKFIIKLLIRSTYLNSTFWKTEFIDKNDFYDF